MPSRCKSLTVFLAGLMLAGSWAVAATTITQALVRDTDKRADTAITITNGCKIDPAMLPKNWTVDFLLSRADKMIFRVDGEGDDTHNQFWSGPYCPTGHDVPLNLPIGTHAISAQIVGQPRVVYTINISPAPPVAQPTTEYPFVAGTNLRAMTDTSGDPALHPQLLSACDANSFIYIRLWTENQDTYTAPWPDKYWSIARKWQAANKRVLAVLQFWGNPKHNNVPTDADWLTKINGIPPAKTTGVWGFCLGNEVDNRNEYFNGSLAQAGHLSVLAYPILSAKGYYVIAPSLTGGVVTVRELVAGFGAIKACDGLDVHNYWPTGAGVAGQSAAFVAYCNQQGIAAWETEWGIRGTVTALPTWAQQVRIAGIAQKSMPNLTALYFPLIPLDGIAIGQPIGDHDALANFPSLLTVQGGPNEPFATAFNNISAAK